MKITIHKVTADGEQVSVEVPLTSDMLRLAQRGEVTLRTYLTPILELMDDRLLEMNKRIIASNYLTKKLPVDAQVALHNVLDVLHGKSSGPATEEVLEAARREYDEQKRKAENATATSPLQGIEEIPGAVEDV